MKPSRTVLIAFLFVFRYANTLFAQDHETNLTKTILAKDSLFWQAYNQCDIDGMGQFISDDVEFYHDKGGLSLGKESLLTTTKKNLCSNKDFRLRREVAKDNMKVFPLQTAGAIYGAILTGEHFFYVLETGKEDRLDGLAKFTHVWLLKDNTWKMSRILSYGHGPAPYVNHRTAIALTAGELNKFAGQYTAPQAGDCYVQRENNALNLLIGDQKYVLHAESANLFFVTDRDLTFEFSHDRKQRISKMIVRENGNVVEEAIKK